MLIIKRFILVLLIVFASVINSGAQYFYPGAVDSVHEIFLSHLAKQVYKELNSVELSKNNFAAVYSVKAKFLEDGMIYFQSSLLTPQNLDASLRMAITNTLKGINKKDIPKGGIILPVIVLYKPNAKQTLDEVFPFENVQFLFEYKDQTEEKYSVLRPLIYLYPYKRNWMKYDKYYPRK